MNTTDFTTKYHADFEQLLRTIEVSDHATALAYNSAIGAAVELVRQAQAANKKIIFVGNGGSAGITSHMAVDFWKNGGVRATTFNDSSLLTCISNDYSFVEVFSKPMEMFADNGDIAFCISSSGASQNILAAANQAKKSGCKVITFSGFATDNPLRKLGDLNFYVGGHSYGFVEIIHNFIIHCILDAKLYCYDKRDVFNKNLPY
ncbi:MAG: SIS domain-containing protein [Bacteroidia bacterium]